MSLWQLTVTQRVLLGTSLLGGIAGVIGAFAVLRRRALVGDLVAHAALPGLATAYLVLVALGTGLLMPPATTALVAALPDGVRERGPAAGVDRRGQELRHERRVADGPARERRVAPHVGWLRGGRGYES